MSYCPSCGKDLGNKADAGSWKTCPYCGSDLKPKAKVMLPNPGSMRNGNVMTAVICIVLALVFFFLTPTWYISGVESYSLVDGSAMNNALSVCLGEGTGGGRIFDAVKGDLGPSFVCLVVAGSDALALAIATVRYCMRPTETDRWKLLLKTLVIFLVANLLAFVCLFVASSAIESILVANSYAGSTQVSGIVYPASANMVAFACSAGALYLLLRRKE